MSQSLSRLLAKRRFLPLFITQFLGAFNDNIFKNALIILVTFQMAYSGATTAVLISVASGLFILPYFLFSALAGQIADKFEKGHLIRIIKFIEVITMLIGAFGIINQNLIVLMITITMLGIHSTFFGTVKYAILPQHLKKEELLGGNALVESSTFVAILLGTCFGGLLVGISHGHLIVSITICTIAAAGLIASWFIPKAESTAPDFKLSFNIAKETYKLIADIRNDKRLYLCILGISWFWLVGYLILSQLPAFTKQFLGANATVTTSLIAVACIGIALGSLICEKLQKGQITAKYVPACILGMTICIIDLYFASYKTIPNNSNSALLSVSAFLTSFAHWRVLVDIFMITFFGGIYSVPLYTMLQSFSDPDKRARVIATNNIINAFFMVCSIIVTIILLSLKFSIPQIFLAAGILNGFVALISCKLLPDAVVKSYVCWIFDAMFRVKVIGLENYKNAPKRTLIIANHVSFIDALLLSAYLPDRMTFAINTYFARKWWMQPILQLVNAFPLDPANPIQIKGLIRTLKKDKRCMIFPEGRLTVTGSLMKIYEGPAFIADKAEAALLPIHIEGAQYTIFTRLKGIVRRRLFPQITITILPAQNLDVHSMYKGRERRHQLGEKLYKIMSELVYSSSDCDKTLFESLIDSKKTFGGDQVILEDSDRKPFNYNDLILKSFVLSNHLSTTLKSEKYIGVLLPNMIGTAVTIFSLYVRGKVPAMLNYSTGSKNILHACHAAQIQTVLTSKRFIDAGKLHAIVEALAAENIKLIYIDKIREELSALTKFRSLINSWMPYRTFRKFNKQIDADSPAVVLFTSGTEGTPKGVVLSHHNLQANRYQIGSRIDFSSRDIIFNALPLFHSFGFSMALMLPLFSGIKTFLYPSPLHYRIIPELIYDVDATIVFGTDTFLAGYARYAHAYDFYSVRYVFAGAERLRPETKTLWLNRFGVRIFEGYGATETAPALTFNTPMHNKPGSVGRLLPHVQCKLEQISGIEEGGRLWVKGPNVMLGYLRTDNPGVLEQPEEGWYDTGDIVEIDQDGFVSIQGRAKRFAKVAGEMVSLTAVETHAAALWPDNLNAAVSIPDPRKGEQVLLFTDHTNADRGELMKYYKENGIAEIFLPKQVISIDNIPVLGTGKINYVALQTQANAV